MTMLLLFFCTYIVNTYEAEDCLTKICSTNIDIVVMDMCARNVQPPNNCKNVLIVKTKITMEIKSL